MKKIHYLNNKDSWFLGEDIPDIDLFFAQIWLSCFVNEFKYPSGRAYNKVLTIFKGYHLWFYYGQDDSYKVGENIVHKIINNCKFAVRINKQIVNWSDKLRSFANKIPEDCLDKLTNSQLWQYYYQHDQIHTKYYQWGWLPVAADMFHNNLTNRLKRHLKDLGVSDDEINEYLVILTQPTKKSLIQLEQEEFLQIAKRIQQDKYHDKLFKNLYKIFEEQQAVPYGLATHTPEYEEMLEAKTDQLRDKIKMSIWKLIQQHYQKYYYVKFMWIGKDGVNSFNYYLKELVKFIGRGQSAARLLYSKNKKLREILSRRNQLIKKLKIIGTWRTIFDAWGDFMVTKIYRRYAQIYAVYRMQPILKEIASRLEISLLDTRFLLTSELKQALATGRLNRANLHTHNKLCVYYVENKIERIFIGKHARELAKLVRPKVCTNLQEIKGQTGCIGKAKGRVKIIIRPSDMKKMNKGDVLVSIATDPDIVPAMKKAGAIVTEQGGVTSHAAIVARELGIPCVIGTKIATKVFKNGDLVEVDAIKGIIRKI
ncbi:MAG: PEP-utilizing enzyme [Patescibacteria group bacterium]